MIHQNDMNWSELIFDVLGSFFATFSAILVWIIIEKMKKRKKKIKIKDQLNKLYSILEKKKFYTNIAADVLDILNEIGSKYILKILKMSQGYMESGFKLEGARFSIIAHMKTGMESFYLEENREYFSFEKPSEQIEIYNNFIEFFVNQCKIHGLNIKTAEKKPVNLWFKRLVKKKA